MASDDKGRHLSLHRLYAEGHPQAVDQTREAHQQGTSLLSASSLRNSLLEIDATGYLGRRRRSIQGKPRLPGMLGAQGLHHYAHRIRQDGIHEPGRPVQRSRLRIKEIQHSATELICRRTSKPIRSLTRWGIFLNFPAGEPDADSLGHDTSEHAG